MKKILAVVLCLCMVIAILAGCSKEETPSSSTPASSTPASSGSTPASSGGNDEPTPSGDDLSPAEKAIAERKESGNYPKVVFSFFTFNAKLNRKTTPAYFDCLTREMVLNQSIFFLLVSCFTPILNDKPFCFQVNFNCLKFFTFILVFL